MKRFPILIVISFLVILSLACNLTGGKESPTEPAVQPTSQPTEPPSTAVSSLEAAKSATIQIESQGSFVDPEVGMVYNAAGRGTGFIIDPSGIAVTNNHVVTGSALIKVWVGGESSPRNARILGVSECWDLAVIDLEGEGYPYLEFHQGEASPGLEVYAAGFPLGDPEYTLTKGIVSKARADGRTSWASVESVIEHDARIRPGNSGGPLVDAAGKVVGVNYAGNQETDQNFAILAQDALPVIEKLKTGDFESIGINGQAVMSEDGSLTGIWVSSVKSGSPADKTGVKGGDILTMMEGLVLATDGTMADYCDILRTRSAQDVITIEVLRFASEEVLEGQLNGRALEQSFSFAQELGGDVASGGQTYSDYMTVQDDYGAIQVSIPSFWDQVDGSPWKIDNEVIGASISAAADLDAFINTYSEPGVFFGVSDDLATLGGYVQLLDAYRDVFGPDCTFEGRYDYQDTAYEGKYDVFSDCAGSGNVMVLLSARPIQNKTAFLLVVTVNIMNDSDLDALDVILDTFDVVGSLP
jgi:serine protease Do